MSGFNARWTFLFLIFDAPYLKRFEIFSIPFSIIFFPSIELIAFEPLLIPRFAASPFLVCALCNFLYFSILFVLSFVGVFARENLFFLYFSSISRTDGFCSWHKYVPRQIFLSYRATKNVQLGRFALIGTAHLPSTIFSLIFAFFFFYHQTFFKI